MGNIKFKKILEEAAWDRAEGKTLPTLEDVQKAYEAKKHLREEYIESMNYPVLEKALNTIVGQWSEWKKGPMTEPSDIKPAQKELMNFVNSYLKKNIK